MQKYLKKIKDLKELKLLVEELKKQGKVIVLTNGCFDLLHPGHIRYLAEAKHKGDILIVALNSDQSINKLKGKGRPIFSQYDRAEMLSALEMVDYIVIFEELTPDSVIKALKPDIHIKGGDYKSAEELPEYSLVTQYGGEVKIASFHPGYSTSKIINWIKNETVSYSHRPW